MEFQILRERWARLYWYSTHSVARAPLVLEEQEQSLTPPVFQPPCKEGVKECLKLANEIRGATVSLLAEYLFAHKRPDGKELWDVFRTAAPEEFKDRQPFPVDADWLLCWFAYQLLGPSDLWKSYVAELTQPTRTRPTDAEVVNFLRNIASLVCYVLRSTNKKEVKLVPPPPPINELVLAESVLFLIAEYAHVDVGLPRRLSIERHLLSLLEAETGLYLTKQFYRDHTFHVVYVCLLGDFLLQCHVNGKPFSHYLCSHLDGQRPRTDKLKREHIRLNWYVASLFHDLGYPLALLGSISRLTKFLTSKEIDDLHNSIEKGRQEGVEALLESAYKAFHIESSPTSPGMDHGVISGFHLNHLLVQVMRDSKLAAKLRPAIRAMVLHNQHDSQFWVGGGRNWHKGKKPSEPLTLLLVLCDELQEWGRVRVDPERYRHEIAAKTQFGGSNPVASMRILDYLCLNVRWSRRVFEFVNNEICMELIYRPLNRSEESYMGIWLLRTRNLQRVSFSKTGARAFLPITVKAHWQESAPKRDAGDDFDILSDYVRNGHHWELDEWLVEAKERKEKVSYVGLPDGSPPDPQHNPWQSFSIDVNKLGGSRLLPEEPDLKDIFRWLRTYAARIKFIKESKNVEPS